MKPHFHHHIFFFIMAILSTVTLHGQQNVGIGILNPDHKLHIASPSSTVLKLDNTTALNTAVSTDMYFKTGSYYTGSVRTIGTSINAARMGFFTFANVFPASLIERMSITDQGNVGIGNINPDDAGLVVDKKIGAVNAMFGRNTTGVALESNYPGIGFNSYFNSGRKTISTGYTGLITLDPTLGNMVFYNSNVSTATDAAATIFSRMLIDKDGDIGVEGNTAPHVPLAFANTVGSKISLYGSTETSNYGFGIQASLMQLYSSSNVADIAFGYGGSSAFTENMRIKGNGNVGIGEINPVAKLHILYNSTISSPHLRLIENDNTGPARIFLGNTAQNGVFWRITGLNSTSGIIGDKLILGHSSTTVGANGDVLTLSGLGNVGINNITPNAPLSFETAVGNKIDLYYVSSTSRYGFGVQGNLFQMYSANSAADIAFGYGASTAFTERMRIKGNGNVGIGNTDPGFVLDVSGRVRIRHVGANTAGIWFNKPDNTQGTFIGQYDTNNFGIWGPGSAGSFKFLLDGNDGVVRIGTLTKATGFLVNVGGKLIAEEVRVQLEASWPDYVFKEDYDLMPLHELQEFISEHNHLPGFEKAIMYETNGADLGENQRKLVEKVEELTLYVLELKKEIEALKAVNTH